MQVFYLSKIRFLAVSWAIGLFVGLSLSGAAPASFAAFITVNSTADDLIPGDGLTTLREAVIQANADPAEDTIVFDYSVFQTPQTILLTLGEMIITAPLILDGAGFDKTILDGNHREIFQINVQGFQGEETPADRNVSVTLKNLTIRNGLARGGDGETRGTGGGGGAGLGGALLILQGRVHCEKIVFEANRALGGNGGGTQSISDGGSGGASSHGLAPGAPGGRSGSATAGGHGFFGNGGGGGTGEWVFHCNADRGGDGGFGAGGGGGGGGSVTRGDGGRSGRFGGFGGPGNYGWINGAGGGGAGLGGAVLVASGCRLTVQHCLFRNNRAERGMGGNGSAGNGSGKGGAIFGFETARITVIASAFEQNHASDSTGTLFDNSGVFSDTHDVYGIVKTEEFDYTQLPVSTEIDRLTLTPPILGKGYSLREVIHYSLPGRTITIPDTIPNGTITLHPALGSIAIRKNLTIQGPGKEKLAISGAYQTRVFFIADANVSIAKLTIKEGYGKGGDGGKSLDGGTGGGGAGMGGGLFVSSGNVVLDNVEFSRCTAQGGHGGTQRDGTNDFLPGAGGGFLGNASGNTPGNGGELGPEGSGGATEWRYGSSLTAPGFGGGGGGASYYYGQSGGFGGGAGGSISRESSNGGPHGGASRYKAGGGGAGLGGALFVRGGARVTLNRCSFLTNQARGGIRTLDSYRPGGKGEGRGAAIYIHANAFVEGHHLSFTGNSAESIPVQEFHYNIWNNSSDVFGSVTNNVYPAALSLKREYRQDLPPTLDVHFILAFNIPITGLDPSDFQLTQSEGLSGCHVESIEPINPTTYRVKVARGTGAGVLAIALLDDNSIRAVASNEPLATHDEQPEGGIAGESYTLLPSVLHFHAILPLDGVHALNGQKAKTGFDQAAAEITRNGGIDGTQVLVMYHDTGSTEEGATQAVQTALNDPLTFGILGAISSQTLAIAPLAVEKQRVLASPATSFEMRNHPRYVLKTSPLDDYQANAMIHHLHANDIKKVIVLADHSPYGADFLKILQHAHAIEVLHSHTYPTGHLHDNSDAVLAAKAALAPASDEIVAGIVIGYAPDANAFLHAVQDDTRFRYVQWLVSDGCLFQETLQNLSPTFSTFNLTGFTPAIPAHLTEHSWDVYYSYDTLIALAQAFQHKKPIHAEALWNAVPGMQFTGLTGLKHFDTEGELISAVYNIYKVRNNAWTVVGQDRVDQPPAGAEHIPAGAAKILLPQAQAQGFKQWLPGNDPCIGHFAGEVGENDTWVAESTDLDIGYNLIAYSDDTCRDRNNYGIEYIFGPGQPYNLSFDIAREELADAPTEGAILEVELTAVVRTVDEEGCENYISAILPSRKITFADWPQPALTRITIPFTYSAPHLPATASVRPEDYFLKWELRLQNTARQKITLHKIWLWAEPLDNPLPPFDSTVEAWTVY